MGSNKEPRRDLATELNKLTAGAGVMLKPQTDYLPGAMMPSQVKGKSIFPKITSDGRSKVILASQQVSRFSHSHNGSTAVDKQ